MTATYSAASGSPLRGPSRTTSWTLQGPGPQVGKRIVLGLAIAVAYIVAAELGFRVAFVAEQVTTVWPPTGLAEAALILFGRSLWPAIWLGAFISNAGANVPLWAAAAIATGNALEAIAAVSLLQRIDNFDPSLRRVRDVVAFIVAGSLVATAISATVGSVALCLAGAQPWTRFPIIWSDWWLGDTVGALVVAPALLTSWRTPRDSGRRTRFEAAFLVVGCLLATQLIFGRWAGSDPSTGHHPLEYVLFPFVIAAAVRFGQPATALLILGASALTIWNTTQHTGPFAGVDVHQGLILLQVFTGVLTGTGLVLAAAMAERKTGERRRAAAHAVGEVLARAPDLETAGPEILRAICQQLDWSFAALWLVDADQRQLRCVCFWRDPALSVEFETATAELRLSSGVGLPGRVWADGKPLWVQNVVEDSNFPRWSVARAAGIRGAFGFPVLYGTEVLGVIECFNRVEMTLDLDLLKTMTAAGYQVGQFMERKRIDRAVAAEQRQTQIARLEAEAANRAKDEFLATLSHELRTPLNAILGWARMLRDGTMDREHIGKALEVIDRNALLQVRLVDDILDVSRIITGGLKLDVRPVDLIAVITAALDAIRPAADAKEIAIQTDLSASARQVDGDPQRLQQVVWNLLTNAVKFTEAGGRVDIRLSEMTAARVRIVVADTGAGIDPAFLPHAFERFTQADGTVNRVHGGLGLGLAIVRHLVELHGGMVRVESPGLGHGATFTIELPRRVAGRGDQ